MNDEEYGGALRYSFRADKAAQAVAHLVALAGGRENYTKVLMLLYLSDRLFLAQTGFWIGKWQARKSAGVSPSGA